MPSTNVFLDCIHDTDMSIEIIQRVHQSLPRNVNGIIEKLSVEILNRPFLEWMLTYEYPSDLLNKHVPLEHINTCLRNALKHVDSLQTDTQIDALCDHVFGKHQKHPIWIHFTKIMPEVYNISFPKCGAEPSIPMIRINASAFTAIAMQISYASQKDMVGTNDNVNTLRNTRSLEDESATSTTVIKDVFQNVMQHQNDIIRSLNEQIVHLEQRVHDLETQLGHASHDQKWCQKYHQCYSYSKYGRCSKRFRHGNEACEFWHDISIKPE